MPVGSYSFVWTSEFYVNIIVKLISINKSQDEYKFINNISFIFLK